MFARDAARQFPIFQEGLGSQLIQFDAPTGEACARAMNQCKDGEQEWIFGKASHADVFLHRVENPILLDFGAARDFRFGCVGRLGTFDSEAPARQKFFDFRFVHRRECEMDEFAAERRGAIAGNTRRDDKTIALSCVRRDESLDLFGDARAIARIHDFVQAVEQNERASLCERVVEEARQRVARGDDVAKGARQEIVQR